jgi:hypothetical protein
VDPFVNVDNLPDHYFEMKLHEASTMLGEASRDLVSLKVRPINAERHNCYTCPDDYRAMFDFIKTLPVALDGEGQVSRGRAFRYLTPDNTAFLVVEHETGPEIVLLAAAGTVLGGLILRIVNKLIEVIHKHNSTPARYYDAPMVSLEIRRADGARVVATIPRPPEGEPIRFDADSILVALGWRNAGSASVAPSNVQYNTYINGSTIGAVAVGDSAQATAHATVSASNESRLRSLRQRGRLPVVLVKCTGRNWDQPTSEVRAQLLIANNGPCSVHQLRYKKGDSDLSAPLSPQVIRPGETMSLVVVLVGAVQLSVSEQLGFRYSTEFGDEVEDIWRLTFEPARAGDNSDAGVSLKHMDKQCLGEAGFVSE